MDMVERVARALCSHARRDPDGLEPGDALGIDGYLRNGDPAHFKWREHEQEARAAIEAMRVANEEVERAISDIEQMVREVRHAQTAGPWWFTNGQPALVAQVSRWLQKADAATPVLRAALTPHSATPEETA